MKVKQFYKILHKAFPSAYIFLSINGTNLYLANPSTALSKYKNYKIVDLEKDFDIYNNLTMFFIKI